MDPHIFKKQEISYDVSDQFQAYMNFKICLDGLTLFYEGLHGLERSESQAQETLVFQCLKNLEQNLQTMKNDIVQTNIKSINQVAFVNMESILLLLELMLGVAVNCEMTEQIIGSFTDKLNEQTLDDLMQITQDVLQKFGKKDDEEEESSISYTNSQVNMNETLAAPHISLLASSASKNIGIMDLNNQQQEKILDETDPNLDMTMRKSQQSPSINRSSRKQDGRFTPNKSNNHEISFDHDTLTKIDAIENQNKALKLDNEKMANKLQEEKQQTLMAQKEIQILQCRIGELEIAHQQQENIANEKQKQQEYELQLKDQNIASLKDQLIGKQDGTRDKLRKLEEELEIERENGIQLEKVLNQKNHYQKVIAGLQEGMEQFQDLKILNQKTNDKIKQMERDIALNEELQSIVNTLRTDLGGERQKTTDLELNVNDYENQIEDQERQLTMVKKREDLHKQTN